MPLFKLPKFKQLPRKAPQAKQVAGMTEEQVDRMDWALLTEEQIDQQFTKNDLVQILNHLGVEHNKRQLKPELIELLKDHG